MSFAWRWCRAASAVVAVGLSGSAPADVPSGGGPGALGTEVPYDSRLAREYFNYYQRTDTPEALRIRDEVQRLHAAHRAAMELGRAGATCDSAAVRALARRIVEELDVLEWTLVRMAEDSLVDLAGAAHDQAAQSWAGTVSDVQAAGGPERDQLFLSSASKVLDEALSIVERLQPQAREARRQQLGSFLARDRKVLQAEVAATRSVSSAVAAQGQRG